MIVGVGLDLVAKTHFEKILAKAGEAFYAKILTQEELSELEQLTTANQRHYAMKHYAVKEAFAKACGTGLGSFVGLKDITVAHDKMGAPVVKISTKLEKKLTQKFGGKIQTYVSISDDEITGAVVILSLEEAGLLEH